VGYQRELSKDTVIEARYVGNRGIKLWRQYNINEINTVENGFAQEYQLAQANLIANRAAGRGNTFRYAGPGTNTSPLPTILAYFSGVAPANAGACGGTGQPTCAALYNNSLFTNATLVTQLSSIVPNVIGFATNVNGSATRRANAAAAGLPANFFQVNPTVQGGAFVVDNGGRSWYDAFVLELRRRLASGLLIQGSYTFSKSLTNMFANSQSVLSNYVTLRNPALNKTRSPFEITHAFKVNWIYELPLGRGRQFLGDANGVVNNVLGGWEWHGAVRVQSGAPFNFGNVQLVGMTAKDLQDMIEVRKNANNVTFLPDDVILNTRRAFGVSPTSATGFSALGVPTGRFIAPANFGGCIQRFAGECGFSNLVLHGPRFVRVDMNLVKRFRFNETTNFELRGEFLNAINNVNFRVGGWTTEAVVAGVGGAGTGILASGTAYQDVSTTNDPGGRLVQIVLRLNF
jgi:hypothetical protein